MYAMVQATASVADEMQGFKIAYAQSDESSFLLTDYDTIETQGWFGYSLPKIVSISAALMSAHFNDHIGMAGPRAIFDARAFNVPPDEIANYFLWRAKDWERNSISMYAQAFFSHKELHGKNRSDMHEMLHDIGKNWADLREDVKNGTFVLKGENGEIQVVSSVRPTFEAIDGIIRSTMVMEGDRDA